MSNFFFPFISRCFSFYDFSISVTRVSMYTLRSGVFRAPLWFTPFEHSAIISVTSYHVRTFIRKSIDTIISARFVGTSLSANRMSLFRETVLHADFRSSTIVYLMSIPLSMCLHISVSAPATRGKPCSASLYMYFCMKLVAISPSALLHVCNRRAIALWPEHRSGHLRLNMKIIFAGVQSSRTYWSLLQSSLLQKSASTCTALTNI